MGRTEGWGTEDAPSGKSYRKQNHHHPPTPPFLVLSSGVPNLSVSLLSSTRCEITGQTHLITLDSCVANTNPDRTSPLSAPETWRWRSGLGIQQAEPHQWAKFWSKWELDLSMVGLATLALHAWFWREHWIGVLHLQSLHWKNIRWWGKDSKAPKIY